MLQIGLGLLGYNVWYAQCEKPLMPTPWSWRRSCERRTPTVCHTSCVYRSGSDRADGVRESKTQKWFLTFRLINLLQLNTFNDFWRPSFSVIYVCQPPSDHLRFFLVNLYFCCVRGRGEGGWRCWPLRVLAPTFDRTLPLCWPYFIRCLFLATDLICVHACACLSLFRISCFLFSFFFFLATFRRLVVHKGYRRRSPGNGDTARTICMRFVCHFSLRLQPTPTSAKLHHFAYVDLFGASWAVKRAPFSWEVYASARITPGYRTQDTGRRTLERKRRWTGK